ncbi:MULTISPECIES: lipoprotein [unclassified Acinetobacter]|nr:lipoprotein [Staphylococcus equorum]
MKRLIFIIVISLVLTGCLSMMGQRLETRNDLMQSSVGETEEKMGTTI